jgi:predicted phosphodiesterase
MRYAILGDIHSNLEAFQTVLEDIEKKGPVDKILCLGDIVGYGPEPKECIHLLHQYDFICVAGNHDWAAVGNINISEFNPDAAQANYWTSGQINEDNKEFLLRLPQIVTEGDFTLAHGSPREPIWEYLLSMKAAQDNFSFFQTKFCLVGHSHIPLIFEYTDDHITFHEFVPETAIPLGENRLIINPGSVGQPRDSDPRASYAIYDSKNSVIYNYRIEYDISATQQKMLKQELPEFLISRLAFGL